jgi:hypothetical protein
LNHSTEIGQSINSDIKNNIRASAYISGKNVPPFMSTLVDATARAMKPVHISTRIVQLRFEYKFFDLRAMAEKGKTNKTQIEDTAIESRY